ncbi:ABC transporter substrate-binding protein [Spirulina subsalsa FACHB-351]|uniref:ABC transporter substrate-binding protein n=1 Tax=Spirulina subsalsa FACHB-351 TaxID=234711 RepID=A0ABT3L3V9_9CYAN|nr:ABC transporter substrate-binding protein [Spirulina subsalsa]MCW6036188.1 ABC transporter substrate-binding protein [Spirulina subsalsa FACHB-351]
MSPQGEWQCDGIPKNNDPSYQGSGEHEPYVNNGPFCLICGLPKEAMSAGKTKIQGSSPTSTTTVSPPPTPNSPQNKILPLVIALLGVLLLTGGGFLGYQVLTRERTPVANSENGEADSFISQQARNAQGISQGEKILLNSTPTKESAAQAFAAKDWEGAIEQYEQAAQEQAHDPESKIYLNNARARKAGNPLTLTVVIPLGSNPNAALEVLRGVGLAQEEYNQNPQLPGRLLEIAIANESSSSPTTTLADDLIQAPSVLGVLGHGVGPETEAAIQRYASAPMPVIAPINADVTESAGRSLLKTIPLDQGNENLLKSYLKALATTLTQYTQSEVDSLAGVIFYNGDSRYGMGVQQALTTAIQLNNGRLVQAVDVAQPGFEVETALAQAQDQGANAIFLALSKDYLDLATELIQANAAQNNPLTIVGGDELYSPNILVNSGEAVAGLVLAVPWSFQSADSFSQKAYQMWKGRVSWRTAAAYDATQALISAVVANPNRVAIQQKLEQGVMIVGTNTDFSIFQAVPLVIAVEGPQGPPGSNYQFDPLP